MRHRWPWLLILILLSGCTGAAPTAVPLPASPTLTTLSSPTHTQPAAPVRPSLAPTFTPPPTRLPIILPTLSPAPPDSTATPVPFDQLLVEIHLIIPGLGLDRQLSGDVAGHIVLFDNVTGVNARFNNQSNILLELRLALESLELEPAPDGCEYCPMLTYELGLTDETGEGWLRDETLLASVENYFSLAVGPHFPPETLIGLRRSASPFAPAHTIAVTRDGRFWAWRSTDDQIDPPTADANTQTVLADLVTLSLENLEDSYMVNCRGMPVETLMISQADQSKSITIICPEYALPSTLQPLYTQLDALALPVVADVSLPHSQAAFTLTAVLDYKRFDGARMTIFKNGTAAVISGTFSLTTTLPLAQRNELASGLWNSGILGPGLTSLQSSSQLTGTVSTLLVRGPAGVFDGQWPAASDFPALADLDTLLDSYLTAIPVAETPTPVP